LPLLIGAVLSGAAAGDNLSIISDTAIAACSSQRADRFRKMKKNVWVAIPAFILTIIHFAYASMDLKTVTHDNKIPEYFILKILPYIVVIGLSIYGLNVLATLFTGLFLASIVGCFLIPSSLEKLPIYIFKGMEEQLDIVVVALLMAGLSCLTNENGAMQIINDKFSNVRGVVSPEVAIAIIVILADFLCANNTVAIILVGDVVYHIARTNRLDPANSACLLDIWSCISQAFLPHGAQLIAAGRGEPNVSPTQLIRYSYYPCWLLVVTISLMLFFRRRFLTTIEYSIID